MSGSQRISKPNNLTVNQTTDERNWPTNLALIGLGGAVVWLAFRFLRWDDPRPLVNPWTYALATPLCLLGLSLVLRRMVSHLVQSSAQVAFLVSIIVHLLLLASALDVVIATRMWPAFFDVLAAEKQALLGQQPAQVSGFFPLGYLVQKPEGRADYLRYVPTEHFAQTADVSPEAREELARSEQAQLASPEPEVAPVTPQVELKRPEAVLDLPTDEAMSVEMKRTEVASPSPSLLPPRQIDVFNSTPPPPDLAAVDSKSARQRADDRTRWLPYQQTLEPKITDAALAASALAIPAAAGSKLSVPSESSPAQQRSIDSPSLDRLTTMSLSQPKQLEAAPTLPSQPALGRVPVPEDSRSLIPAQPALQPQPAPQQRFRSADRTAIDQLGTTEPSLTAIEPLVGPAAGLQRSPRALSEASPNELSAGIAQQRIALPAEVRDFLPPLTESQRGSLAVPAVDDPKPVTKPSSLSLQPNALTRQGRLQTEPPATELRLDFEPAMEVATQADVGSLREASLPKRSPLAVPSLAVPSLEVKRLGMDGAEGLGKSDTRPPMPARAFQQRVDRLAEGPAGATGVTGPQTERAIELGLAFLAQHQRPDGCWRLQDLDREVLLRSDTAATGLCLLAFQGAGYTHQQFKYADANARGLKFLIEHQTPSGDLYIRQDPASDQNAWLYSHAIATLAICEAYGMTQDEWLRRPAQAAVDFMVTSQEPTRGGWRYRPNVGSDTSVTGWFTMALKSAQLAGLEVPQLTFDRISKYLRASQASADQPQLFRYNPYAPDTVEQRHGLKPTHVMTSVGLLMRMYLGWQRELPEMQAGADYLLTHLPVGGSSLAAERDTYYWYYATQVLFHMGGQRWQAWNDRLRPVLLESQIAEGNLAGSWDPYLPSADLWARYGGRLYVTTMNLLSLEVNYRHLPLYEATAR